jgi:hypothetical protein
MYPPVYLAHPKQLKEEVLDVLGASSVFSTFGLRNNRLETAWKILFTFSSPWTIFSTSKNRGKKQ